MANVENKTAAVPPVESQQAPKTVAAAVRQAAQEKVARGVRARREAAAESPKSL